jgi:membrane protein
VISTHAPTSRHPRTSSAICSSFTWIKAKSGQSIPVLSNLIKKIFACVVADDCSNMAAQMSFYFVLAVFPFFIVLAALVGWLPSTTLWQSFAQWITGYLPAESRRAIFGIILGLSHDYTGFLSFGLLATLWTASSGFLSLMESLSVVYGQRETRSYWRRRGIATCATIVAGAFLMGAFGLLALGHKTAVSFSTWDGAAGRFRAAWITSRWLTSFALLYIAIRLANHLLPNIRRRWRWLTPGTLFAAIALFGASHGFNIYLRYVSNVPKVYGALAGFILLMIWIYVVNLLLLVGAETDRVTERQEKAGALA